MGCRAGGGAGAPTPPLRIGQTVNWATSACSSSAVRESSWLDAATSSVDALVSSADALTVSVALPVSSATVATSDVALTIWPTHAHALDRGREAVERAAGLLDRGVGRLGQLADFLGHDREAAALLAGAGASMAALSARRFV